MRLALDLMRQPLGEPDQQDERYHEDRGHTESQKAQKNPVFPGMPVRLFQVARHQCIIAPVGFPCDVEHISQQGNGADNDIDGEVHDHTRERDVWHTAKPCGDDENAGGQSCKHIAQPGDEADDAVQSEANGGTGNAEPVIEQMRQQVEILIRKEVATNPRAGWETLADRRKDIWLHALTMS